MNSSEVYEGNEAEVLASLPYYMNLRLNKTGTLTSIRREPNQKIDWLQTSDGEEVGICHFSSIVGMTLFGGPEINGYQEQAAVMLALQQLNDGDGSIVPTLEGLNERCPIRFTYELQDNDWRPAVGTQQAIDALARPEGSLEELKPCAFYGARASVNTIPIASFLGINDYVQVTGLAFSPVLDNPALYPLIARTYPSSDGTLTAMVSFLASEFGVKHLAILNVNNEFGNSYVDQVRSSIIKLGLEMDILQIPYDEGNRESQKKAAEAYKKSQYRYVFLVSGGYVPDVDTMLEEALNFGLIGTSENVWLLENPIAEVIQNRPLLKGSPQHLGFRGHGFISIIDYNNPATPPFFANVENMRNAKDINFMNSLFNPIWEPNRDDDVYMARVEPIESGQFLDNLLLERETDSVTTETIAYDAAIALGLATCDAYAEFGTAFTGKDQFQKLVERSFVGASGTVRFPGTGTRDPDTFVYGAFTTYEKEFNATHVTIEQTVSRIRVDGQWQFANDFYFGDREIDIPSDLPPVEVDENVISPAIRGIALALYGIILLLVVRFGIWTRSNVTKRVVAASQPFFLFTLLSGIVILASTIVPLTFDHDIVSIDGCVIACNSTVWLVSIGFSVTFSALFTKNYRINRILKQSQRMRRVQLTVRDTIIPMVGLLLGNSLVLVLMTILAPVDYVSTVVGFDEFDRPNEIFFQCSFEDGQLPYIITLAAMNSCCLLFAIFQAWEARNLSVEFSESIYIFQALLLILLVALIGIPVILLARDDANSQTFLASAIIFVMSASILLVIFVPKIRYLKNQEQKKPMTRPSSSLITDDSNQMVQGHNGQGSIRISGLEMSKNEIDTGLQVYGSQTKEELFEELQALRKKVRQLEHKGHANEKQANLDAQEAPTTPPQTNKAIRYDMAGAIYSTDSD